ncbi:MAG: pyridoxine 5'-phosphate synthase [Planctomycetota bacterium]|nr:pyridoxine 5'-phosphate synthase [Planctomycetota bacterium]
MKPVRLAINVDHVATVRNARGTPYPDPAHLAVLALNAGADGIVAHLREDRRHINERDVEMLRALAPHFGFEFALEPGIVAFAEAVRPDLAMLVPERREEITTESGIDVLANSDAITVVSDRLQELGIPVSLFIDPIDEQLEAAAKTGAQYVELHTGPYAEATHEGDVARELERLRFAARRAAGLGLRVNAGHGLTTQNVGPIAAIPEVEELSIGHAIISRALSLGMEGAVCEMLDAMRGS